MTDSDAPITTPETRADLAAAPEAPADPPAGLPATHTAPPLTLADVLRERLASAGGPLPLKKLTTGLPKSVVGKRKAPALAEAAKDALDADARVGQAFVYASGKGGEERYWSRDEKHLIREEALRLAETPTTLPNLVKGAKGISGADAVFAESTLRELIAEDRLFEHPPAGKGKTAKPLFGRTRPVPPPPPPHPLDTARHKKKLDALVKSVRSLLDASGASAADLFERLRLVLGEPAPAKGDGGLAPSGTGAGSPPTVPGVGTGEGELGALIRDAVAAAPPGSVLSLPDLRRNMPSGQQGRPFDDAVLQLAREEQVALFRHNQPGGLTEEQKAAVVTDGHGNYFTGIAARD